MEQLTDRVTIYVPSTTEGNKPHREKSTTTKAKKQTNFAIYIRYQNFLQKKLKKICRFIFLLYLCCRKVERSRNHIKRLPTNFSKFFGRKHKTLRKF